MDPLLPRPLDPRSSVAIAAAKGRLKCTGRTVYTKGRFFTLYADKAGKRATRMDCRDVFDSVVFFSRACWVGKKEDNPDEEPLPLPESLQVRQSFVVSYPPPPLPFPPISNGWR